MSNTFSVNTYSPDSVQLIIAGYQVVGWEDISIARTVKGFNIIRGIRGKNSRIPNVDTSATLSFNLLQTVQSNDVLTSIHQQDLVDGTGRLAITLRDNSGRSVFATDEAYIVGFPAAVFSANFEYRRWEIFCQTTNTFQIGGNSRPSTGLLDSAINSVSNSISGYL